VSQPHVKAQATVDLGRFEVADRVRHLPFVVHVTGELYETGDPLPARDYEIAAIDDSTAAFAGIDRYVLEMQRLN
jgi:hypothetical protein